MHKAMNRAWLSLGNDELYYDEVSYCQNLCLQLNIKDLFVVIMASCQVSMANKKYV